MRARIARTTKDCSGARQEVRREHAGLGHIKIDIDQVPTRLPAKEADILGLAVEVLRKVRRFQPEVLPVVERGRLACVLDRHDAKPAAQHFARNIERTHDTDSRFHFSCARCPAR